MIDGKFGQNDVEIPAVENIKLRKWDTSRPDFFHRRLILIAPGIRKLEPIYRDTQRRKKGFRLSGN